MRDAGRNPLGPAALRAATRARAARLALDLVGQGESAAAACRAAAAAHAVSASSVRRWLGRVRDNPGVATTTALANRPRPGRPPSAWAWPGADAAWAAWRADYLRLERPTAAECTRRLARLGAAQSPPWRVPGADACLRRLRAETPPAEIARMRLGRVAALSMYPAQERTVADLAPLEWVCGDGRMHDVRVELPGGGVGRPVVWYWQDVRTRRLLSWRAAESETSDIVRLSFHDLTRWGLPDHVLVDNTHAVSARCLSHARRRFAGSGPAGVDGIWDLLGIDVRRTGVEREANGRGVGWGQAKPVERAFRDLADSVDREPRLAGAYTGSSPERKPANYGSRSVPWELFLEVVGDVVRSHNARGGRRTEAAAGRSLDEAWAEEYPRCAPRRPTAAQRALLLLAAETTRVAADGTFRLRAGSAPGAPDNRYWMEELVGHRVTVVARFDPDRLHAPVHVHAADGAYLGVAACLRPAGFADRDAAREHGRRRRRWMRALDAADRERVRIDEALETLGAAPAVGEPEPPAPTVVRLVEAAARGVGDDLDDVRERLDRGLARGLS